MTQSSPYVVGTEPLSIEEEVDFLTAINNAVAAGTLTDAEAAQMIDREYDLLAVPETPEQGDRA